MNGDVRSEADIIINLPNNIIDNILGCLPLRDVVRTSILSREWRYKWLSCPDIVFDFWFDQMFLGDHKLEPLVYEILRLHKGPLRRFVLQVPDLKSNPDIDEWISLLPNKTLQDLALHVRGDTHRLTPHLFSFQHLRNLKLYNCVFEPPVGFKGFSKLESLELQSVALVPETFGNFLTSCQSVERLRLIHCTNFDCLEVTCPKLKYFEFNGIFGSVSFNDCTSLSDVRLTFSSMDFKRGNCFSYDLVKSLSYLPALKDLQLQAYALEDLVEHGAPNKLPISLKNLKHLHLSYMFFEKIEETACAICFIRSCPNLHRLKITALTFDVVDPVADFLRSHKSAESLSQLKTVSMQSFSGIEAEMEFVKYLLASATSLQEMAIMPHTASVNDGGESILNELKRYPRASPNVEIVRWEKIHGKKSV